MQNILKGSRNIIQYDKNKFTFLYKCVVNGNRNMHSIKNIILELYQYTKSLKTGTQKYYESIYKNIYQNKLFVTNSC